MLLIPAIDIIDGRCVRLTKGDYATQKVYAEDPVEMAVQMESIGYRRLHVVDLDGARSRHVVNLDVLRRITRETHLVVDFGGGVKTEEDLHAVLDAGAQMVTLGSVAVTDPELVLGWLHKFGAEHIVLGADVRDGRISINGWKEESTQELLPFIGTYMREGIRHVLCTEISRDGTFGGPAIELYQSILQAQPTCQLIASGGVGSMDDIRQLDAAGIPAVVFGKAIYEGRVDLRQLLEEFPQPNL
ncbi:MAG: 1-(5-phosphoribosyl)-5-[(5-phosphoribosylamino)methylideneamino]imidazole-4-carboxamide isomerase [Bacteroidaceae bacterium]|nr:1-(5-phosphoribosyl)-5-[(5-phosphoribosylamino)methylideneamino]imidazole-4-carboxamide isomerase [Bacteroidaceae bacterium]